MHQGQAKADKTRKCNHSHTDFPKKTVTRYWLPRMDTCSRNCTLFQLRRRVIGRWRGCVADVDGSSISVFTNGIQPTCSDKAFTRHIQELSCKLCPRAVLTRLCRRTVSRLTLPAKALSEQLLLLGPIPISCQQKILCANTTSLSIALHLREHPNPHCSPI